MLTDLSLVTCSGIPKRELKGSCGTAVNRRMILRNPEKGVERGLKNTGIRGSFTNPEKGVERHHSTTSLDGLFKESRKGS